jgi:aldehyde:ferredoxin oxidoreductase
MGSKNLKAIAAKGSKSITIANPKAFSNIVEGLLEKIHNSPATQMWRDLGFVVAFPAYGANGLFERYNYGEGFHNLAEVFSKEEYKSRIVKRPYACPGCPVGCKQIIEIKDGKYRGLNYRVAALGSQVGYHNQVGLELWDEVVKCVELENKYGMDSTSTAGCIGLMIELYKQGIITIQDTDGIELDWGIKTALVMIEKIVRREGIGDIVADGVIPILRRFGPEAEKYASHMKGVDLGLGIRGRLSTENFGQFTNPRGGHLERSASLTFIPRKASAFPPFCKSIGMPDDRLDKVCEGPEGFNVSRLTKWVEDYNTILISMGMCHPVYYTQLTLPTN